MKRIVLISLLAVVFVACQDGTSPTDAAFGGADFGFVDGAHNGGNEDFFFLPPLTSSPKGNKVGDRPRNPNLNPFARVCQLNATEIDPDPSPDPLECVDEDGENIGQVANLAMTLNVDTTYSVNWQTGDPSQTAGVPLDPDNHYRIEIFVGNLSLGFRDVDPDPGPPRGSCKGEDFCQFNNGSNVAIKTIIESGAACLALDPNSDPNLCATATLGVGGQLVLPNIGIATVGTVTGPGTAAINLQLCPDLRDKMARPTAGDGLVDNPTFGDCIDIAVLEDLDVSGTATLCAAFDAAVAAGVDSAQAERMTVHRFGTADDGAVALPHSAGVSCIPAAAPQQLGRDLNGLQRFARFVRSTWRAVSDQVLAWIEPTPLWARRVVRCNRDSCSTDSPFRSHFQVGLPVWMDAPDGTDLGSHTIGTVLPVRVRAQDSGEHEPDEDDVIPDPSPELANDVRLNVTVTSTSGTVDEATIFTGPDGIAQFQLTVGPGDNTVVVTGIGVGTASLSGTTLNVFGPSINSITDPALDTVPLLEGTLTFTATGIVPFGFFPDPPTQNLNLDAAGITTLDTFEVCTVDENGDLVTGFEADITSLAAIKNNGDPVILGDVILGSTDTVTGCLTFTGVTINKTGAYRLVVNGEFVSLKFNVRPKKKK